MIFVADLKSGSVFGEANSAAPQHPMLVPQQPPVHPPDGTEAAGSGAFAAAKIRSSFRSAVA
jgi:hypothetical protein